MKVRKQLRGARKQRWVRLNFWLQGRLTLYFVCLLVYFRVLIMSSLKARILSSVFLLNFIFTEPTAGLHLEQYLTCWLDKYNQVSAVIYTLNFKQPTKTQKSFSYILLQVHRNTHTHTQMPTNFHGWKERTKPTLVSGCKAPAIQPLYQVLLCIKYAACKYSPEVGIADQEFASSFS